MFSINVPLCKEQPIRPAREHLEATGQGLVRVVKEPPVHVGCLHQCMLKL